MNDTVLAIFLILAASCMIGISVVLLLTRPKIKPNRVVEQAAVPLRENELEVLFGVRRAVVSHAQDVGLRESQQDAYGFTTGKNAFTAALCDGMGGMQMGQQAARLATDVLLDVVLSNESVGAAEALAAAMNAANEAVLGLCAGKGGTTAILVRLDGAGLSYAAVGDSRIYLYRRGVLKQLGTDHVLYYDLIRSGALRPEEAAQHPEHTHLTSYLGKEMLSKVNATDMPLTVLPGDVVLLVSDGISKTLGADEIASAIEQGLGAPDLIARTLLARNPQQDNLTCLMLRIY